MCINNIGRRWYGYTKKEKIENETKTENFKKFLEELDMEFISKTDHESAKEIKKLKNTLVSKKKKEKNGWRSKTYRNWR